MSATNPAPVRPSRPGQFVRSADGNSYGVTTDFPRKRTPQIPVMWMSANYPTLSQIEDVELAAFTPVDLT